MERIGLIPAAGFAKRIGPLPCSKEIYPLGFKYSEAMGALRPLVACQSLLEKLAKADSKKCFVIIRPEKVDLLSYLRSGKELGLNLAYLVTERTSGVPFTIDNAFSYIENALVLFGFPDIIFSPDDAFVQLVNHQRNSGADIVLGLYRARQIQKMDMVGFDSTGKIREIIIKPSSTDLEYTWIVAVWTGVFTKFLHSFVSRTSIAANEDESELYIGDIIREGIQAGLSVESVIFNYGDYVDIGTPEDLIRAVQENIQALKGVDL